MCELFAMSSHAPATVSYSLYDFARNGSQLRSNHSGWGIAYFEDRDVILIREAEPAVDSPWVRFIREQALASQCVIAHVRHATVGKAVLRNTHPFRRALGGCVHAFAHNGTLADLDRTYDGSWLSFRPVGETDSELAFCLLLHRLREVWEGGSEPPTLEERADIVADFAAEMSGFGPANFLYSDGELLFAYGHKRVYEENGRFTEPRPPGLCRRICSPGGDGHAWHCQGMDIGLAGPRTTLFASVPLEDEGWEPLPEGTLVVARDGEELMRRSALGS